MALAALAASLRIHYGLLYFALAAASWVALVESGVDPVVVGLAAGLIAYAAPPARTDLERTSDLFRDFREQPTAGMARQLRAGVRTAVSPNDRLQQIWHPWTSYLIVPLFGLANAGIPIDLGFLAQAYTSPITLGIVVGYVVGKPAGVMTVSALVNKATRGRLRPPVGWMAALGGGTLAGMGFTVSLLVASVAFTGVELKEATLGVLTAAVLAALLTWLVFQITRRLPSQLRTRALLGQSPAIVDLADPVDGDRDHIRGPADAARHPRRVRRLRVSRTVGRRNPSSGNCWPISATCVTCGAICHSTTCTRELNWRPRHPRRPRHREPSGRCTTC